MISFVIGLIMAIMILNKYDIRDNYGPGLITFTMIGLSHVVNNNLYSFNNMLKISSY
jgi:hypothetical protein